MRKESLRRVQFSHFDHNRRRLTIFTKGAKVRTLPIVEAAFWDDLGRHIIESGAEPDDYLLCRRSLRPNRHKPGEKFIVEYRDQPMGVHGLHKWWYRCLQRAGIVATGQTSGKKMHMARHTAGQTVLDKTGNLKAVQSFSATRRSPPPVTSTPTGTSTSSSRRCVTSSEKTKSDSFPPTVSRSRSGAVYAPGRNRTC